MNDRTNTAIQDRTTAPTDRPRYRSTVRPRRLRAPHYVEAAITDLARVRLQHSDERPHRDRAVTTIRRWQRSTLDQQAVLEDRNAQLESDNARLRRELELERAARSRENGAHAKDQHQRNYVALVQAQLSAALGHPLKVAANGTSITDGVMVVTLLDPKSRRTFTINANTPNLVIGNGTRRFIRPVTVRLDPITGLTTEAYLSLSTLTGAPLTPDNVSDNVSAELFEPSCMCLDLLSGLFASNPYPGSESAVFYPNRPTGRRDRY